MIVQNQIVLFKLNLKFKALNADHRKRTACLNFDDVMTISDMNDLTLKP